MNILNDDMLNDNIIEETTENKIKYILEEMKKVYLNDSRPWIVGYSGGKDSTVVTQLVFKTLMSIPKEQRTKSVYIVSSDTLIENPIILQYLDHNSKLIGENAKNLELPIYSKIVHPDFDNSFWANVIGKGLPTPTSIRFRWCTERLKIKPSNTFIQEKVEQNGEVIVLLGVRKAESIARKIRIENREIDGYLLTPHESLQNTYVYNPIVELTTDDVWNFMFWDNARTHWGGNNIELMAMYQDAQGGECPFIASSGKNGEIDTPSCGKSRFGCWLCTVVNQDKSLTGFIYNKDNEGNQVANPRYDWMKPLLDFREWILSVRDKHELRQTHRRDGNHYYKKVYMDSLPIDSNGNIDEDRILLDDNNNPYIDLNPNSKSQVKSEKDKLYLELLPLSEEKKYCIDASKIFSDEKGKFIEVLGYGPFNFEGRKLILEELLKTQVKVNELKAQNEEFKDYDFSLITLDELKAIDTIWDNEEDLTRCCLVDIYYRIVGKKLPWHDFKNPVFDEVALDTINIKCQEHDISDSLLNKLLLETDKYKFFSNKKDLTKTIDKLLNQKYLHKEIYEEVENAN